MSNITERISDVNRLNKLVRTMLNLAMVDIKKAGISAEVFETYRTQERQNYLYCTGRTVKECVSEGINKEFASKYCTPEKGEITWTLTSQHTQTKAVDLVPKIKGKLTWDNAAKEQQTIVKIMSAYGFECGANWKNYKDSCHYQVKGNFGKIFNANNNTTYVTEVIQRALNKKVNAGLTVDGIWGKKTTQAVNKFRKSQRYLTAFGQIGAVAFTALMK